MISMNTLIITWLEAKIEEQNDEHHEVEENVESSIHNDDSIIVEILICHK